MKIVFTGGGTGGHFYPIIAIAQKVNQIIDRENIVGAKLYYFSDSPYDKQALFENGLLYEQVNAGKMRIYFSLKNISDMVKVFFGTLSALVKLFSIYPDVVFGKGGYASFPTLLAARILRIPVVIHESDSAPGRVNKWAGSFAERIALSYKDAAVYFPAKNIAWTGQPVRSEIENITEKNKALRYFKLESELPVVLVLGGSQGAELINNVVIDALPELIKKYQVIHQTGVNNFKVVHGRAEVVLGNNPDRAKYTPLAFLNPLQMKNAAGAADIVVSRAGSQIFEIAAWGIPSILIPITNSNQDHQKKNAFAYARAGCCSVIEEMNMTSHILISEIDRLINDKNLEQHMKDSTKNFYKPDAAMKIAREIVNIALSHEK
jgi:UDP-N-acetylglucosamine--N-acetylmuramyl-(pentapeptide) pyrophosphoryl-undecaprenol N-acetylglucosamine transferase